MADNFALILIILNLAVWSLWLVFIAKLFNCSHSFRLALLAIIVIFAVNIVPTYLYFKMPSLHAHLDANNISIFGAISFKSLLFILVGFWICILTSVILYFIYKTSFENSFFMALLLYLPCIILVLIFLLGQHYNPAYFNLIAEILLNKFAIPH